MRRYDKKQNILEANLRLEKAFVTNKNLLLETFVNVLCEEEVLTEEQQMDNLLIEVKQDFINGCGGNKLNEGFTMAAIGMALAGGKLMDLIGSGIKKLLKLLVKLKIISPDGKVFNKSEKAANWMKEKGEWWSNKIMSFFTWVAGGLYDFFIDGLGTAVGFDVDTSNKKDVVKNMAAVLFYLTIFSVWASAIWNFGHLSVVLKGIEGLAVAVKSYELGAVVVGFLTWRIVKSLRKHKLRDIIHTLEGCVEDVTHKLTAFTKNTLCTVEKISSHGDHGEPNDDDESSDSDEPSDQNVENSK